MSTAAKDAYSKARHDLRTPINQIIGYSELLEEEAEDAGHDDYIGDLKKIQKAARRMLELVEEHLSPDKAPGVDAVAPAAEAPVPADAEPPPREIGDAADEMPAKRPGTDRVPTVKSPLLVVDDNEMNRDMLSRRLKSRGYIAETRRGRLPGPRDDRQGRLRPGAARRDDARDQRARGAREAIFETKGPADLPVIMATAKDTMKMIFVEGIAQDARQLLRHEAPSSPW